MQKTNYIALTLLCLLALFLIKGFLEPTIAPRSKQTIETPIQEKLQTKITAALKEPTQALPIILVVLVYLLIFLTGLAVLIVFIVRKILKLPMLGVCEKVKLLPLNTRQTSRILFWVTFLVLVSAIMQLLSFHLISKQNLISALIISNTILEISIIILILRSLPLSFLDFKLKGRHLLAIVGLYTAMMPILVIGAAINKFIISKLGIASRINPAVSLTLMLKQGQPLLILTIAVMFLAPLAEELLFRGVLFKFFRRKTAFWPAALSISLFFAIIHKTPQDVIPLTIISLCLCYIYEKTQSIASPIIFHLIFNSVNISMLMLIKTIL